MKNQDTKILLVDDEPDILEIIGFNLEKEGYNVQKASNGLEAIEIASAFGPHLILLDIMMPEMDGIETCEKIRANPDLNHTMIAFLTARGEDYSHIAGFEAGADDYITKPIKPKILISKLKSLLRRVDQKEIQDTTVAGDIVINRDEYHIVKNGQVINLPKKEFELFSLLASKPNKVFKREVILNNVWGNEVVVGGRTIDVHIRKLREKIGDDYFKTIKGVGYKFVTE